LDRIATRNVYSALARIQFIACERRQEVAPIFEVDGTAAGELLCDSPGTDSFAASEWGSASWQVNAVGVHQIKARFAPAQSEGLDIEIAESQPVDTYFGTILDI
jgi:hypothetical protein